MSLDFGLESLDRAGVKSGGEGEREGGGRGRVKGGRVGGESRGDRKSVV